ncbi:MAG: HVO_0649 family zinc finger protein [Haloferacaceae archaeon]
MASAQEPGASAFDRLRGHYAESRVACPECGHEDTEGGWRVTTSGSRVDYQHVCPSCGAVDTLELRL